MTKEKEKGPPPPLPSDWDRCHAYLTLKKRYCRQERTKGLLYCGNHFDFITTCTPCPPTSTNDVTANDESEKGMSNIKRPRLNNESSIALKKRIRCPLDGSHTIYEAHLKSHLKKCNAAKNKIIDRSQAYYRHGVNQGGCGSLHQINVNNEKGGDDRNNNVIKSETKQVFDIRIECERGQRPWRAAHLQFGLLEMVRVDMGIAEGVDKVPRF